MARSAAGLEGAVIVPVGAAMRALGWSRNRTKRWLRAEGILHKQRGQYGRTYTTLGELCSAFPGAAHDIRARILGDE